MKAVMRLCLEVEVEAEYLDEVHEAIGVIRGYGSIKLTKVEPVLKGEKGGDKDRVAALTDTLTTFVKERLEF